MRDDIVAVIRERHAEIRKEFQLVLHDSEQPEEARKKAFRRLSVRLRRLGIVEEGVLYVVLERIWDGEDETLTEAYGGHALIAQSLQVIEKLPFAGQDWRAAVRDLELQFEEHGRIEEELLFPRLGLFFDPRALTELGTQVREAYESFQTKKRARPRTQVG